ncbi:methylated-DNA--[protein]-cysteine S-methyltransferase [Kordiimonas laminariae]|uniref:methylated-DNA--[protein]-cysteine S-methyltransferase n=1 Tax=Kordiimonas laminariae TaxID=2917717 RepID=UPI001FF11156|nr:methylated-DNA--[protein]-cysteine S-methyltransferase [Kordiimonas laminariae]MCK0068389.1 methylated-DNA--[protein]-cysteine S-methyltransferase [Kordiimonas laminariae]
MATLYKSTFSTPVGGLTILLEDNTMVICEFADRQHRVEEQIKRFYPNHEITETPLPESLREKLEAYFAGDRDILNSIPSGPIGTPYEQSVWKALQEIPAGNTMSYGELAKQLGSSPRAIGRANGRNPVCLIHPCHRVIGADGSLTGYAGGLDRKEWLLKHEGAILNL